MLYSDININWYLIFSVSFILFVFYLLELTDYRQSKDEYGCSHPWFWSSDQIKDKNCGISQMVSITLISGNTNNKYSFLTIVWLFVWIYKRDQIGKPELQFLAFTFYLVLFTVIQWLGWLLKNCKLVHLLHLSWLPAFMKRFHSQIFCGSKNSIDMDMKQVYKSWYGWSV